MLQNRYPKHTLESTHSTHRSQATDLLPIAMTISDPKETKKNKKKKKVGSRIRTGDKLASLEYSTLTSLPESSYDWLQSKLLSDTENKTKSLDPGATTNEDQSRTSHSSPWNFQILKLTEIQKRNQGSAGNDNTNVRNLQLLLLLLLLLLRQLLLVVVSENWFLLVLVHFGCLAHTTFFNWRKLLVEVVRRCQLFFGCQQTTTTTLHDKR